MWNKKEMGQLDAMQTRVPLTLTLTFDLEFSRSNCISGTEDPIVMEQEGRESMGCPDVKLDHYVTSRQRILLGTGLTQHIGVSVDSSSYHYAYDIIWVTVKYAHLYIPRPGVGLLS